MIFLGTGAGLGIHFLGLGAGVDICFSSFGAGLGVGIDGFVSIFCSCCHGRLPLLCLWAFLVCQNSCNPFYTYIRTETCLLKLRLLVILWNPHNLNICQIILFTSCSKTALPYVLISWLTFAHSTDNVSIFIL